MRKLTLLLDPQIMHYTLHISVTKSFQFKQLDQSRMVLYRGGRLASIDVWFLLLVRSGPDNHLDFIRNALQCNSKDSMLGRLVPTLSFNCQLVNVHEFDNVPQRSY
uniref:Uncharacterized protein MANES_12G055200 n=1 Tax=Rhizophora mucronata TaxID=61149 RepID=A0A2P2MTL3_RHIMU